MNTENDTSKKAALRKHIRRLGVQVGLFILLVAVAVGLYVITRGV